MKHLYNNILQNVAAGQKMLAVLIDPDKMRIESVSSYAKKVNASMATHIFVGGSTVAEYLCDKLVGELKKYTNLPIILFPGDVTQITNMADALLFLSLISGNNPDYLIGKHVQAVSKLQNSNLEIIPTGYILVENGKPTMVEKVTKTKPMSRDNLQLVEDTAVAAEYLGMKLVYLEAGSGASMPVSSEMIAAVKRRLSIPLIVGGGIRTKSQLVSAYEAGADMVVIGTALEQDESFFDILKPNTL
ncbi:geranylgeranylglyceryl/heptaprenylglyceryl phosphate synthase [Psychroserpens sp.]|uniref:geranylgeranylglyceryl/heptaprenylglyceryl phosphate synthase n=1 Tax=Psychroserpens sp. TaxID=2020870 RepID=UPI001B29574E|nr:geranylgeranylglyceryl/heptaprenylglyceryl phosphate synthase [Psychroserpens sp.]MBO6605607.1 geranylgeranylglyceryl/heptaprenylglyceryl phosphate synthase [Psychroserpens sp.]MBO6631837.1 geranylgeranylglyceryl/heptaprenylglyceryl phosphate synthase [Psychroserpens sp.]MBO6653584.1 geranylgeranylglyceryl/heptaprenylglyceryl phosphate synthase [Psychroserpens sp.]MBO6681905.1 geranylgeranylglyceryl/heptaprenylglyceryl phosphate synthase [Psychroserpens sp.]MBO6748981.1 geranylgeranylglycer